MSRLITCANALLLVICIPLATEASAATRSITGTITAWDIRETDDSVGSRHPSCDDEDFDCSVGDEGCCYKKVPYIQVTLHLNSYKGTIVDVTSTNKNGAFTLRDRNWRWGRKYYLSFQYVHENYPASIVMTTDRRDQTPATLYTGKALYMTVPSTQIGERPITHPDKPIVRFTGWTMNWLSLWELMSYMDGEGEYRYRKVHTSPAGSYDTIVVYDRGTEPGTNSASGDSLINYNLEAGAVLNGITHEFGHIFHKRVVGFENPSMPPRGPLSNRYYPLPESFALNEAIANLINFFYEFDPATTPVYPGSCDDDASEWDNYNDCSMMHNNVAGLWEWLDTSVEGSDVMDDWVDVTLADLFTGLENLSHDVGSGNNHNGEFWQEDAVPGQDCVGYTDSCDPGDACEYHSAEGHIGYGQCITGDVHGSNIADWAFHLAELTDVNVVFYWVTLTSSPCIGYPDSSYPYTGGYRTD